MSLPGVQESLDYIALEWDAAMAGVLEPLRDLGKLFSYGVAPPGSALPSAEEVSYE